MPAWIQGLLLLTLVIGVGVAGWLLWSRAGSSESITNELGKGPLTGSVNGLDSERAEDATVDQGRSTSPATPGREEGATQIGQTEPPAAAETVEPPVDTKSESETTTEAKPPEPTRPPVPTQGLPRDPAKASDVLVHRALPLIRQGRLGQAQATLDRAFELDPKNPQAMAGYATLFIATKDGDPAEKWARRAVRRRPKRAPYHVLYGDALALQGKQAEARSAYRKALSIDPQNRAARSRLAEVGVPTAK